MYDFNDTITAISSASAGGKAAVKTIIRISGADTFSAIEEVFIAKEFVKRRGITRGNIRVDEGFEVGAVLYTFAGPRSYTGQDLAELHVFAAEAVVERILGKLNEEIRLAGPGEFTLRAYLNGKVDLSQAEAVAEIVASSNKVQLAAAEKLLAGKLSKSIEAIRGELLDILSLLEAGMDFSGEDIEFVSKEKAVETVGRIRCRLEGLLNSSIRYEEMIDEPSVGLAGAANAGKSSLGNALLGEDRSIVSEHKATTRDVLTGELEIENFTCTLFDCAGLSFDKCKVGVLDGLAQAAAIEALNSAEIVVFCVDITKDDFSEDTAIRGLIRPKEVILAGTKSDLPEAERLGEKRVELNQLFGTEVILTSAVSGAGLNKLREVIDKTIINLKSSAAETDERLAITQRHRKAAEEAVSNLAEAENEIKADNDETAAMFIRASYQELSGVEREDINEEVLERIFSNFCIGK